MRFWFLVFILMLTARSAIVTQVPENCFVLTFLNVCLQCLDGYQLDTVDNLCNMINGTQINETISNSTETQVYDINQNPILVKSTQDLNCKFKGKDGICSKCYPAFYVNQITKMCQAVNPLCKTWNDQGNCLSCFSGYQLVFGICQIIIEETNKISIKDPNCFKYAEDNSCQQCAFRFYFNTQKICTTVDPDCKTWDNQSGACLSCYAGYDLKGPKCFSEMVALLTPNQNSILNQFKANFFEIPNCSQYNQNNECAKCAFRFFYSDGECKAVSHLCKSWSITDGQCKSCYAGYQLFEGKCERKDPFCTVKTKQGCIECVNRYYLDENSKCQGVSPLCKAYDTIKGDCTQCYQEYALQNGACIAA